MTREIRDELTSIAQQLAEQLTFYREIGVNDMTVPAQRQTSLHPVRSLRDTQETPPLDSTAGAEVGIPQPGGGAVESPLPAIDQSQATAFLSKHPPLGAARTLLAMPSQDESLETIRVDIGDCRRCKLWPERINIVFGEGNPRAKVVFVGEGPGADEDETGRPFVGRAGRLLDKIIASIGLRREDVYICNVVKCRPPGNRTPERDEIATCEPFLFRQLAFIQPKIIVALGLTAFQCLLESKEPLSRSRGLWRDWNGAKLMPTFHPAYLLRSPEKKREAWEDMKKVRDLLSTLPE